MQIDPGKKKIYIYLLYSLHPQDIARTESLSFQLFKRFLCQEKEKKEERKIEKEMEGEKDSKNNKDLNRY